MAQYTNEHATWCLVCNRKVAPFRGILEPSAITRKWIVRHEGCVVRADPSKLAGVVLVFKAGVSREEAEKRLRALSDVLEGEPKVQVFNPERGYPCFYIP